METCRKALDMGLVYNHCQQLIILVLYFIILCVTLMKMLWERAVGKEKLFASPYLTTASCCSIEVVFPSEIAFCVLEHSSLFLWLTV